ncbi:hypothetical protein [Herbiconiux solani]|uniref:hypothetical protein n=1 Tax=Herbiconiux solani TaxID=661329 RepID=UPI00082475FF|nr:hypothetical protein [Herbiconiux solani]
MTAVLLTGSRAPATLELARQFAASGAFVVVADSQPALASGSKSVGKAYRVPSARFRPREFAAAIAGIARRHAVDLVIPCNEEIFWLAAVVAEARERRARGDAGSPLGAETSVIAGMPLFAPPPDTLRRVHDKAAFSELLGTLGIPQPDTTIVASRLQWRRLSEKRRRAARAARAAGSGRATGAVVSGALVVKPAFSRFGARTLFVGTGEELPDPGRVTRDEQWVVQERVVGDEFSAHAVAVAGQLTAFVSYRSVSRAGAGAGVAFERLDPRGPAAVEARRIASLLAAELDLTGQFGLDLIERTEARPGPDDSRLGQAGRPEPAGRPGQVVVLECNPRATSGLHLFTPADDLPAAFVRPIDPSRPGPVVEGGRASARLGLPHVLYGLPALRSVADVRRFARQLRSPDVLRSPGDAVPPVILARSLAVQLSTAFRARVPLLAASTHDIEWNGEPLLADRAPVAPRAGEFVAGFTEAATAPGCHPLVENADVVVEGIEAAGILLPLTRPRSTSTDHPVTIPASYVVSPITHYVHYAREELRLVESRAARVAGSAALAVLERVLRAGRADDVAIVGNALVSTNLLPDLGEAAVADVTGRLAAAHPELAIAWRSVHGRGSRLPESLRQNGYRLIPSRSVLFAPTRDAEWESLRDVGRDRALLEGSGYAVRPAEIDPETGVSGRATLERIAELYGMLYLGKYSRLNPDYSPEFIALAQRSGLLSFLLLERDGRIDGVIGYTVAHGLLAAPVVGYDTTLPQEAGLYRMLSYLIARTAHDESADLHASSGVADFKRHRGAEPELEYFAVYARHLGIGRRAAWAALDLLVSRVAAPAVLRAGL